MGLLKVLDGSEEETYAWHPENAAEVERARRRFREYRRRGFAACRISCGGREGAPLEEFDPQAEEIFMLGFVDGG